MLTCPICDEKISRFNRGSFLNNQTHEICFDCHAQVSALKYAASKALENDFDKARTYLEEQMMVSNMPKEVKESLTNLIEQQEAVLHPSKSGDETTKNDRIKFLESIRDIKITTGFDFQGFLIEDYLDVIVEDVVLGTGLISEFGGELSDSLGTESTKMGNKLSKARKVAMERLKKRCIAIEANAIIGIDFDYTMFKNNLIGVSVNGTAVKIRKEVV